MSKQPVAVSVDHLERVEIEELHDFQGNLKDLSTDSYQKLKAGILKHGMSFAIHVWENEGRLNILDGHQRLRTLKKMREEGYDVPAVPIVKVNAKDFKEARELVLAGTSQYGEMTDQGLYEFIAESGLDWRDVVADFRFPEIDFTEFAEGFFGETVNFEAKLGAMELDENEFSDDKFEHECPKCGFHFNDSDKKAK